MRQGEHLTLQWSWPQYLKLAVPLSMPHPSSSVDGMVPECVSVWPGARSSGWWVQCLELLQENSVVR